jgi:glycosyltransferase involved in cell wall biosynthesis
VEAAWSSRVVYNARFRGQRPTGVQVYAAELLSRLESAPELRPGPGLPAFLGHAWEQVVLPRRVNQRLLFSPANTGPLAVRRQVVTIHDLATLDHPEWFSRPFAALYRWLLPRLARRVARVLTVSEFSRGRLLERLDLPPEQVVVTRPGVSANFRPMKGEERAMVLRNLGLDRPYVLCVASLDPRKNIRGVLETWRRVEGRLPEHELVVAGGASPIFRQTLESTLPPRARLLGYVEAGQLPALYSGAELFVYLAHYEGFGLTPLEAMACGAPVLCSSTTALAEAAGPGAATVHPDAVDDVADLLLELMLDPSRRATLAARGREHAAGFTWEACARDTKLVLESVEAETR